MTKTGHTVVLYTTAVCNLNCRYCFIDKNPALKKIDDILEESFNGDYYFEYCKEIFADKKQLKRLETWGGEPFLRMDRLHHTLRKLIDYYPNLNEFYSSTNMTPSNWIEQFSGLMGVLGEFAPRKLTYSLQLSLDGPKDITDAGRGEGVTDRLTENFDLLLASLEDIVPKNVMLNVHFKPTLDAKSIHELQTEEAIINYYKFFEDYYDKAQKIKLSNFHMAVSIPNTAQPSPHTKEDGVAFKEFCRLCRQIEERNKTERFFKYYNKITPYLGRGSCSKNPALRCSGGTCGTGRYVIGLLPNRMISACHMAFVDLIGDYKQYSNEHLGGDTTIDFHMFTADRAPQMTFPVEKLPEYDRKVGMYYTKDTSARLANIASLIQLLAINGQVDDKYKSTREAISAANFIQDHTSYCMRDNYASTGSLTMYPIGILRLLLNGAKEYIDNEYKNV